MTTTKTTTDPTFGWFSLWQQFYEVGQRNWNDYMTGLLSNEAYGSFWSQYSQTWTQAQTLVGQFNERLLQASGIPTRNDLSRTNRQLYDLANRLDELEERLAKPRSETDSLNQSPS